MMKKTLYFTLATALLVGSLTSCDDYLEAENKTSGGLTADQFFESNPTALLYGSFASLRDVLAQVPIFDEGTDLYMNTRGHSPSSFGNYNISTADGTVQNLYVKCYGVINYANGVLKYASPTSTDAYEARFLRGMAYYYLTQHFGAVPYVDAYVESASREYPRTPLSELYPSVIEDLTNLYNSSSLSENSAHDGHVSKKAVAALLAKLNLAAGWDLDVTSPQDATGNYNVQGTSYFTAAASWADKALQGVSLYSNFNDKWLPANDKTNQEEFFSIQYERNADPAGAGGTDNTLCQYYGGYPTGTDKSGLKYVNSDFQQNEKSMYLFEKGDQRYEGTFMTTFYDGESLADGYMAYFNGANPDTHKINARWFPYYYTASEVETELNAHLDQFNDLNSANSFKAALLTSPNVTVWTIKNGKLSKSTEELGNFHGLTNNGTCVKKFDDPQAQWNDLCYRNIVVLHASEAILVAAEANLMAGNTSAFYSNISKLRERAGLKAISSLSGYNPAYSTTSNFGSLREIDLLLDERAREMYAERTRWEDLRRTKQLVRYNEAFNSSNCTDLSQIKWYRPIPENEIQNNTSMTNEDQNPGY